MSNTLIVIGYLGIRRCYLNVEREEAITRYCAYYNYTRDEFDEQAENVDEFTFEDEFEAYDAYSI